MEGVGAVVEEERLVVEGVGLAATRVGVPVRGVEWCLEYLDILVLLEAFEGEQGAIWE